ncbi:PTS galactosamine transporter subunit IIC [Sebaldella sp. S0638]|uniref:PTS galactosamine transporter subunit IIC n=1 Tax=Sebaldella sp. S0638 TaxID=2957809 RepID=UPI0020A17C30|nr:PTS galactosamine transporter subunit IIC [Sebaldella sp. S0638]MCP1223506.1 PTS galactosamine transporter subunit IIC [Sebaldella sp. S0638]
MLEISLFQGICLAVMAFIVGIDFWLEALFIFRPLIVSTLTGLILGDLRLGLLTGALTELAFAGLTPAGGTQPPNPVLAGVMTTVIAYTAKVDAKIAIGLALPFSFLMQYIILFYYSIFSFFMKKADKYAEDVEIKKFYFLNLVTTLIVGLSYAVVVFVSSYVAQEAVQNLVNSMPGWLTHGFEVAGGILPAVGFGLLLRVMLQKQYVPYLIIGFVVASFLKFSNLLPIALLGTAFAIYEYFNQKKIEEVAMNAKGKGDDDNEGI